MEKPYSNNRRDRYAQACNCSGVPGVFAIPAPGYTPEHLAVVVSSPHAQLLHMVDSVLHPMNLEHPAWRNVFDLNEDTAATTRRQLLDRAAAASVLAYH